MKLSKIIKAIITIIGMKKYQNEL